MNEDTPSSVANSGVGQKETDATILQLMANDQEEEVEMEVTAMSREERLIYTTM